jgi:exodeoxyribonuclease V alpha subunit
MAKNRELVARFVRERHAFGEGEKRNVIADVIAGNETGTVKGHALSTELSVGMTYRFYGHVRNHPKYGEQFWFSSFAAEQPMDDESYVAYLMQCRTPQKGSITERVAWALVEVFGGEGALNKVLSDPVGAAEGIQGGNTRWSKDKAAIASKVLRESENMRHGKMTLIALLDGRGFPKSTVDTAIKRLGTNAAAIIRDDPYCMMNFAGCGFKGADKLYCDLAKETSKNNEEFQQKLAALRRQALCGAYAVRCDRSGSTWVPRSCFTQAVRGAIASQLCREDDALRLAVQTGVLCVHDSGQWVALSQRALNESEIAKIVNDFLKDDDVMWPDVREIDGLSDHQKDAFTVATSKRIGLLQGSPGTGKSYSLGLLVKQLIERYGDDAVCVACPTGKASVRVTAAMADQGVTITASTIHRLLIVERETHGGWSFYYGSENPLPCRFIIIDEPSMIDVDLMAALLRACSRDCHILMTGDGNQLAPVGHGKPFVDMQKMVPTGYLTEIRRNSGRIVRACAEIRDTKQFNPSPAYDEPAGENLPFIEVGPADQPNVVLGLVQQIERSGDCDPIWDLQVLTAVNKVTPVSRRELNPILQRLLNPKGEQMERCPFRVGDKIVCLANGAYWLTPAFMAELELTADREMTGVDGDYIYRFKSGQTLNVRGDKNEVYVANGELAEVKSLELGKMVVRLFDPAREVTVPLQAPDPDDNADDDSGVMGSWDLGYVLSGHKSQGSQWQYAIVVIDPASQALGVQSRNWLYTTISRSQKATFCVGQLKVAKSICLRDGLANRKTFLSDLILQDRAATNGFVLESLTAPV